MMRSYTSESEAETEAIAAAIASRLQGGEVIELVSDVGGGKTTFVRGLAKGINSTDKVASPTFTISRRYDGDTLRIYHYDFYRIDDPEMISYEFDEQSSDPAVVRVVEWAERIDTVLPARRLVVSIVAISDSLREITITFPEELEYIMKEAS